MQILHVEKTNPNRSWLFKILILAIFIACLFASQNLTATNYFNSVHTSNNSIKLNDSIVLRGRIIDSADNSIADASVFVFKRRLGGVLTNSNGEFSILVKNNDDRIVVAKVGYIITVFYLKPLNPFYVIKLRADKNASYPSLLLKHSKRKEKM